MVQLMFKRAPLLLFASVFASHAFAWEPPTYGDTSITMGDSLAFGGTTKRINTDIVGTWQFNAALTGLAGAQSNSTGNDPKSYGDVANAQAIITKPTGLVQVFAIAGYYSIPELTTSYVRAATQTVRSWSALPVAYASIVPDDHWSLSVGNLFSLGGAEGTFSYENTNIQRGLLWGQTNSVSQGAQLNYQDEAWTTALAWTDGAKSGTYNWLGFSAGYKLDPKTTVFAIWNGALSGNPADSARTPLLTNNSQISNLVFAYKGDKWGLTPYLQYSVVNANPSVGIQGTSSTQGAGLLATYRFTPLVDGQLPKRNITLPMRLEYINTWGNSGSSNNNLLYGPGSAAWSATITPTYQNGPYFGRFEASYVNALNACQSCAFGSTGNTPNQTRAMLEVGVLF